MRINEMPAIYVVLLWCYCGATVVLLWCYCGATVLGGFCLAASLTLPQIGGAAANGLRGSNDPSDPHDCNGFYQTHGLHAPWFTRAAWFPQNPNPN